MLARVISRDLRGNELTATYKTTDTFQFQDAIGDILMQLCEVRACGGCIRMTGAQTVPGGILVFFSSYTLMDKLEKRWRDTALWNHMSAHKIIVSELRGRDKAKFDASLNRFYKAVREPGSVEGACVHVWQRPIICRSARHGRAVARHQPRQGVRGSQLCRRQRARGRVRRHPVPNAARPQGRAEAQVQRR